MIPYDIFHMICLSLSDLLHFYSGVWVCVYAVSLGLDWLAGTKLWKYLMAFTELYASVEVLGRPGKSIASAPPASSVISTGHLLVFLIYWNSFYNVKRKFHS